MIVLNYTAQVFDKVFHLLLEGRMDVSLYTSNHVVVLNQTASGSFFKNIQNHLTFTETIEERSQSTHIHDQTGVEQQV